MTENIQNLILDAEEAFSRKEWEMAIDKYKLVLEANPQSEDACSKLAELFAIRGLISDMVEMYFTLMDILDQKEEYDLAIEVARWIIKIQPENDKARMNTILILKKKGNMEEVVVQSLQLAKLYIELGEGDKSILLLKNAQEIAPTNLDIGLELAEMYISHGHLQEGTNQYRKIANAYMSKGEYEKATEAFRRMKVVIPDDPQLLYTLGNLYLNLGKFNEAEAEFRAILRHNLNHTDALMALGEVCQKKGQFRDAILAFNKILSINPQDERAKEKLGELYHAQGSTGEAVKHYLQAAGAYQYNENIEKAIKLYQRVISIDPTNPTACRELTNLGAPLTADENRMEEEEETTSRIISPLDMDDDDLDMEGSLEEIAGVFEPEQDEGKILPLEEEEEKGDRESFFVESKEPEEYIPPPPVEPEEGQLPAAFEDQEDAGGSLEQDLERELSFQDDEGEAPSLGYEDDSSFQDEESFFDGGGEEDPVQGKRGLRKKEDAGGHSLRRGLSKKSQKKKTVTALRSGVASTTELKKPTLSRRKRSDDEFEDDLQYQEPLDEEFAELDEPSLEMEESGEEEFQGTFGKTYPESLAPMDSGLTYDESLPPPEEFSSDLTISEYSSYGEGLSSMDTPGEEEESSEPFQLTALTGAVSFDEEEPPEEEPPLEEFDLPGVDLQEDFESVPSLQDELPPEEPMETGELDEPGKTTLLDLDEEEDFAPLEPPLEPPMEIKVVEEVSLEEEEEGISGYDEEEDLEADQEIISLDTGKKRNLSGFMSHKKKSFTKTIPTGKKIESGRKKGLFGRPDAQEQADKRRFLRRRADRDDEPEIQTDMEEPLPGELPGMEPMEPVEASVPAPEVSETPGIQIKRAKKLDMLSLSRPADHQPGEQPEIGQMDEFGMDTLPPGDEEIPLPEIPDLQEDMDASLPDSGFDLMMPDEEEEETSELVFSQSQMASSLEELEIAGEREESLPEFSSDDDYSTSELPEDSRPTSFLSEPEPVSIPSPVMEEMEEEEAPRESPMDTTPEPEVPAPEAERDEFPSGAVDEKSEMDDLGDLLKLAEEIESIIPDEDRIKEAQEQKKQEEERRRLEEEEARLKEISDGDEAAGQEEDVEPPATSFVVEEELAAIQEDQDALAFETFPELPEFTSIDDIAIKEEMEEAEEEPLPEEIIEGIEDIDEIEVSGAIEEITPEIIEEIPVSTPLIDPVFAQEVADLLEQNQVLEILPLFAREFDKNPDNLEIRKEYAGICYNYGLVDETVSSLCMVLESDPSNHAIRRKLIKTQLVADRIPEATESLVAYGNLLTSEDKIDDAQRIFQHVLALKSDNPRAREALSEIYLNLEMKQLALYHLNILADYLEKNQLIDESIKVLKKIFTLTSDINTQEKLADVYVNHGMSREAAEELRSLGEQYVELGDLQKAAQQYEKVVSLDNRNLDAHMKLAGLYDKSGDSERGYRQKVLVADLLAEEDSLHEARAQYEECLRQKTDDNDVRYKLVSLYLHTDEMDGAIREADVLASVYQREDRHAEAVELLLAILEKLPGNLPTREKLSEFYVLLGENEKGLEQLTQVAASHCESQDWDSAIRTYRKILAIDSRNPDVHFRIGEIFLKNKNNRTEARYEFELVMEIDPSHQMALEHLVSLYLEEDNPARAIGTLQRLIDIDPSFASLKDEIIESYRGKIQENPEDYHAHFNLGVVYKELKLWKQAIEQFQTTRKSKDHVLESHNMLGICFAQQPPMQNLAVKTLEKGLELKGFDRKDYIELHYNLGVLYEKMGKTKKAAAQYESVLAIDPHYGDASELLRQLKT
jgi:tetratricopeptide (TPR) repeat protein